MRRIILSTILLFFVCFIFPVDYETFKKLSPEEQIDNLLEEYQNDMNYSRQFGFQRKAMYLIQKEIKDVTKPIVIGHLLPLSIIKYQNPPFTLNILISLLTSGSGILTEAERLYLVPIMQDKIDEYIQINKMIDVQVIYYTWIISERLMIQWGGGHPKEINPYTLQKKYLDAGYQDVVINWAEIEDKYHVSRNDYKKVNKP